MTPGADIGGVDARFSSGLTPRNGHDAAVRTANLAIPPYVPTLTCDRLLVVTVRSGSEHLFTPWSLCACLTSDVGKIRTAWRAGI